VLSGRDQRTWPTQMEPDIPNWVPPSAKRRLAELLAWDALPDKSRKLIVRLATDNKMKTEVWTKLPEEPPEHHRDLISFVLFAVTNFSTLIPHPNYKAKRTTWINWIKLCHDSPPIASPESGVSAVVNLMFSIIELKSEMDTYWRQFWTGDPSITPNGLIDIIEQLWLFYQRLEMERQQILDSLPKVKRPFSPSTPRKHFSRLMSDWFTRRYGRPFDHVVTGLTEVVFDLRDGLEKESVRSLRRPAKSRRKPP
jgi:hypothetical protein